MDYEEQVAQKLMGAERKCVNCYFFQDEALTGCAECRKNPPTVLIQNETVCTYFPETQRNGWCGEFKLKL